MKIKRDWFYIMVIVVLLGILFMVAVYPRIQLRKKLGNEAEELLEGAIMVQKINSHPDDIPHVFLAKNMDDSLNIGAEKFEYSFWDIIEESGKLMLSMNQVHTINPFITEFRVITDTQIIHSFPVDHDEYCCQVIVRRMNSGGYHYRLAGASRRNLEELAHGTCFLAENNKQYHHICKLSSMSKTPLELKVYVKDNPLSEIVDISLWGKLKLPDSYTGDDHYKEYIRVSVEAMFQHRKNYLKYMKEYHMEHGK